MSEEHIRIDLDEVYRIAERACRTAGFSAAHAGAIARTVRAAERDEAVSHGLFRVPFYVDAITRGDASGDAEPELSTVSPGVLRADARYGFAPLTLERAVPPLADAARSQGIAALSVVNAYNVAALWPEVERLASEGLVAMAFTASLSYVAPAGGTKPLFGTNPMAFAWPREGAPPVVFDQASSASARGEIQVRQRDGDSIPQHWAVDAQGRPTTDPDAALSGAQLPFGGHKGSSIALMIELLAGALLGDLFSCEATEEDRAGTGAPRGGELVIAMAPERFEAGGRHRAGAEGAEADAGGETRSSAAGPRALSRAEALFERILEQDGTRLPGDRRYAARRRTKTDGVAVPAHFYARLRELADLDRS